MIVAFSRDGRHFGSWRPVRRDELGSARRDGETYGDLMVAPGVRAVRVRTDRPLARLSVLALTDRSEAARGHAWAAATQTSKTRTGSTTTAVASARSATAAAVPQPAVIPRSGWGASESLRFNSTGKEIWPPQFWPVQKLIVHHTATQNNDPNPAATIRSIYYYHAVTQGWGDIGYNFLIDEAGNIYEGRYSRAYAPGASPTGQDLNGNGVTAAHAQGFNSGTVGIALLGTLTNQDATPAARDALERLLAWEADGHGIDPQGSALYTNPVSGAQATFPNIAGHRDVAATECPGGAFYGTLPTIRSDVAARIAAAHAPDTTAPTITSVSPAESATGVAPSANVTVTFSEAMDKPSAEAAFSLTPTPVSGAFSWNGNVMTFDPSASLVGGAQYTARVTTAAKDLAQNPLPAEKAWNFSTVDARTGSPAATVVETGSHRAGTAGNLGADDDLYYDVNSTTSGTRTSSWYGSFTAVPNGLSGLKVTYKGMNSRSCTQRLYIKRWTDNAWVRLDSRSVGTSEVLVEALPGGSATDYVSGAGELQFRVQCTASKSFYARGDLMRIDYNVP